MLSSIPPDLLQFLRVAVEQQEVYKYTSTFREKEKVGDGSNMGDFYYVTVRDTVNIGVVLEFALKIATNHSELRRNFPVHHLYGNECLFYGKIWRVLQDIQNQVTGRTVFNLVPKCFAMSSTMKYEKLIMENLRKQHFENFDKRYCFKREHLEYIFDKYGKFHALSLAYKVENRDEFYTESINYYDYFINIPEIEPMRHLLKHVIDKSMNYLREEREYDVVQMFEKYVEHPVDIYVNSVTYTGSNGVYLHGDSWSGNIMIKYDDTIGDSRKIVDLKFIDFQLSRVGSPVHDLSYCLYSGGTEEIFNDLDHFLDVYHKSLSMSLRRLRCDPDIIYPYATFKQEWKEYSRFGFIMSLMVMSKQLVKDGKEMSLSEILDSPEEAEHICDEDETRKRVIVLARHMYNNNFL